MTHIDTPNHRIHQGRNVKRFREMLGIKQEALAADLGEYWSQKKISVLEQKESIEPDLLKEISEILKIPVEAFENFDEEHAVNIISNTFDNGAFLNTGHTSTFNLSPIEEVKRLHEDKIAIYERMLREKDEMMLRLERLIDGK